MKKVLCAATSVLLLAFGASTALAVGNIYSGLAETERGGGIETTLSVQQSAVPADEDVFVTVTMRNNGERTAHVLKWYTPYDDVEDMLFTITRDGQPVSYLGPHYKRAAPRAADYLRLAPGKSFTRTVEISSLYDFSKSGAYQIQYNVASAHLLAEKRSGPAQGISSNAVGLWVVGRAPESRMVASEVEKVTGSVSFTGRCSATRQSTLLSALNSASTYANNAVSYLNGTPGATPRYSTWFGAYSSTNWNTVKANFGAIKNVFDVKPITFDCSCKKSYYAYVYPTQPYKIYLCKAFWLAPMTGTDSMAGTLIHETSHFDVVAATDDVAYGQSAAKSLALTNPSLAITNADSHEYFAENTPFQP